MPVFVKLGNQKKHTVILVAPQEIEKSIRQKREADIIYLDTAAFSETKISTIINNARTTAGLLIGIIDSRGAIKDPALLFLHGPSDYIGTALAKIPQSASRFEKIIGLLSRQKNPEQTAGKSPRPSGLTTTMAVATGWDAVKPGQEHLFTMMHVELDGQKGFSQRLDRGAIGSLVDHFQKAVAAAVTNEHGRVWIWKDFGGIVLFPAGRKPDDVVASCLRLMLSRRSLSIDMREHKVLLSYRIVLLNGSTIYHERGKTGRIISDAVNSLSHIGIKFAAPGNFYITDELAKKLKSDFRECFTPAGEFEGLTLQRMKLPLK